MVNYVSQGVDYRNQAYTVPAIAAGLDGDAIFFSSFSLPTKA